MIRTLFVFAVVVGFACSAYAGLEDTLPQLEKKFGKGRKETKAQTRPPAKVAYIFTVNGMTVRAYFIGKTCEKLWYARAAKTFSEKEAKDILQESGGLIHWIPTDKPKRFDGVKVRLPIKSWMRDDYKAYAYYYRTGVYVFTKSYVQLEMNPKKVGAVPATPALPKPDINVKKVMVQQPVAPKDPIMPVKPRTIPKKKRRTVSRTRPSRQKATCPPASGDKVSALGAGIGAGLFLALFFCVAVPLGIFFKIMQRTRGQSFMGGRRSGQQSRKQPKRPLFGGQAQTIDQGSIYERAVLLSPAEKCFLKILDQIVNDDLRVFSKVRLADIVKVQGGLKKGFYKAFNKISGKHVDFVLADPETFRVICVIELDDASHNDTKRQQRDEFVDDVLRGASIPILHFPVRRNYELKEIHLSLSNILQMDSVKNVSDTPTCNACGADMVLRTARKGASAGNTFWGCSNYPTCTNVMDAA